MSAGREDLIRRARERAEAPPTPAGFGYRLPWTEPVVVVCRWRGETTDEEHDNRRRFLLWDEDNEPCFSRDYASLCREIDRVTKAGALTVGCTIVIAYTGDYETGYDNPGKAFGVETEPNDDPLPGTEDATDDGIPFLCPAGSDTRSAPVAAAVTG